MADDIAITPGSGATVRTIDKGDAKGERQVVVIEAAGSKTFFTAAPTTTAAEMIAANADRKAVAIYNNSGATVYLGKDATVSTANGFPLPDGAALVDNNSTDAWFAVMATGTGDLRGWQVA